jgi:hypothetical protein
MVVNITCHCRKPHYAEMFLYVCDLVIMCEVMK